VFRCSVIMTFATLCAVPRSLQYYVEHHNIGLNKINNFPRYTPQPQLTTTCSCHFILQVIINVNDGRTPDPTLLPRIETTVAAAQVSSVPQSVVGHRSCSSSYSFWYSDIIWLCLLAIVIAITFFIYKVYFISDCYHSIIY